MTGTGDRERMRLRETQTSGIGCGYPVFTLTRSSKMRLLPVSCVNVHHSQGFVGLLAALAQGKHGRGKAFDVMYASDTRSKSPRALNNIGSRLKAVLLSSASVATVRLEMEVGSRARFR